MRFRGGIKRGQRPLDVLPGKLLLGLFDFGVDVLLGRGIVDPQRLGMRHGGMESRASKREAHRG